MYTLKVLSVCYDSVCNFYVNKFILGFFSFVVECKISLNWYFILEELESIKTLKDNVSFSYEILLQE